MNGKSISEVVHESISDLHEMGLVDDMNIIDQYGLAALDGSLAQSAGAKTELKKQKPTARNQKDVA